LRRRTTSGEDGPSGRGRLRSTFTRGESADLSHDDVCIGVSLGWRAGARSTYKQYVVRGRARGADD
jgi:hypothetical protein